MEKYYIEFMKLLEEENRYDCVNYAINLLKEKKVNIVQLYEEIIKPSIQNITCKVSEKNMCVWQEHVRSAIVRTVIESCYTYVIEERNTNKVVTNKKVVVLCPEEEYHDIGARMISDFFTILGYESIFVGSNTPKEDFLAAVEFIKPDIIAISVTNYYNLVAAKVAVQNIKSKIKNDIKIIAGGSAFASNKDAHNIIGADYTVETYADIKKLGGV